MTEHDSSITRRQLGRHLREAREAVGMTLEETSTLMEWGKSSLQRLEKGLNQKVRIRDLDGLIEIYGIEDEEAAGLRGLAKEAAEKSWLHEFGDLIPANFSVYMGLESAARRLTVYQPDLVPGLLQIADYARVLAQTASPTDTAMELAGRVQLKMRRQQLINRKIKPASMDVVLFESVLRRMVGGRAVMEKQLRSLADASTRPNITIRVLPFSAGMPTGEQIGPFVVLEFGEDGRGNPIEPTTVYAEGYTSDMYSEKVGIVQRYTQAHKQIQQAALDENDSRILLRMSSREYQRERRPI
ncbi:helix-turn-helix domain-containing protein [Nocardia jiangxiensis]|uniref:Helix-turn-helix domain-containing protein n=1 Tax=Nocardia jiangxiensis TaxID=282685 RepID=A0ABW6SA83_9NOCA|nr:helix-turn-helix transcriptional regulator [Nocardia jiangxiensis]